LSCHERGSAQFNSYNSGRHKKHLEDLDPAKLAFCTDCHDTAKLASSHFVRLDTPGFEGVPADTLLSDINYDNSLPQSTCTFGPLGRCHDTTKHENGINWISHDIPYAAAVLHGTPSKADLADCQDCHGIPGTIQFDSGTAATGCSTAQCHPAASAHPTRWQGTNDVTPAYASSHRTAGSLDTACAICHNVAVDAPGPNPNAPSCFSAGFTNSDGSTTGCHSTGPGVPHAIPFTDEGLHGPESKTDIAACQQCHGNPGTIQFDGGTAATGCSTAQCHPAASAHPTRWQGTNDITPGYTSSHRNAGNQNNSCTICHDFTQGRTAPDPQTPSCFSASFTNADGSTSGCHSSGPGAPHALPFTDAGLHGPEARADLPYCQQCHADPFNGGAGSNPRFNVPLGNMVNGCEDCHTVNTAHPVPLWAGTANNSHKTAGKLSTACALCHGTNLQGPAEGGVGRACADCHQAGDPLVDLNCTSCHNDPPDSAFPAGNTRPNLAGSHGEHDVLPKVTGICISCHNGAGTDTSIHYDENQPADVSLLPTYNAKTGTAAYNAGNSTCSAVSCHGGKQTPNWPAGTLDVDTDCLSCHERGSAQFNSYNSGKHQKHVEDKGLICTDCHDTNKLATNHFIGLDTPGFEGRADQTLRNVLGYNPSTNSGCNVSGCHGTESWF
jgi:predicted CxxxxCH...CXXCH cytochrome family protein